MSIVTLKKVSVFGLAKEEGDVLNGLQDVGCMHLIPLSPPPDEPEKETSPKAQNAMRALQYLSDVPGKRRQVHKQAGFDVDEFVEQVLENKHHLVQITDLRDFLRKRIGELSPWGDFELPPEGEFRGWRLWFYIVPVTQMRHMEGTKWPWHVVHRTNKVAYVVVIAPEEPPAGAYPVPRTHTGSKSLSQLEEELEQVEIEIEETLIARQTLTRYLYLLQQNLNIADDRAALRNAHQLSLRQDTVFAVQGWVAEDDVAQVRDFADTRGLAYMIEDPAPQETPPTKLDNPPTLSGGEDVTLFYQTPNYREWDPSVLVFFSFAIFFAMILSDAGYALVLLVPLLAFWRKMGGSRTGKRLRALGLTLCVASVVWGVAIGSYFGVSPPDGALVKPLAVVDLNDFDTMMKISIVVGVVHVAMANAVVAVGRWGQAVSFARLGWIAVLFGGLAAWWGGPETELFAVGLGTGVLGLAAVFAFSSTRKVATVKDGVLRVIDGLLALTDVTKIFGDVLSYLRLFALGLASASLAVTFNSLATQVMDAVQGVGLLFGLLILLVGHVLNLGLSIMSGVVHGLRLNFIEFYNWGLSEEGYPFKAFERKEVRS